MTRSDRRRTSAASAATSIRSTEEWTARSLSKSSRPTESVSAGSSAVTVAARRSASLTRASSPKKPPVPSTDNMVVSPDAVPAQTANRPFATRCSESPGSPAWKTTSLFENRRRRATARSRRRSSSDRSARSGQSTLGLFHCRCCGAAESAQERLGVFQYQYSGVSVPKLFMGDTPPRFFEISNGVTSSKFGSQLDREIVLGGEQVP